MFLLLAACAHHPPPPADTDASDGRVTVTLTTRDGVSIVADEYLAPAGRPGVVLLHMIPPSADRTTWPQGFIDRLDAHDWAVIVPDRRGAGDSGGVAVEAYEGEKGRYDVEACVSRLVADGAGAIAIIGASNGTTSMIDYATWAGGEGLPVPVALGFMTGGDYTENNTRMNAVPQPPAIFTFSTEEREWSVAQQAIGPDTWVYQEYPNGAHGTRMFDAAPAVSDDLDAFLAAQLE